ncbi:hypothetical protein RhiirC2_749128 [Rhizophagus irregularis]|uniref:Uncharacterized protein n=1 Tax=Rhizophagus irregularis TaxID=588596 RepID=A0A2N1N575_9GLOM|nr:hypothetical protein RhiirC2_749128 [Rhizophagus irregularis]
MKSMIIFFLIHKFLDTAAAADGSNGNDSSGLKTSTKIIIAVVAVIGVFVIGTLIYCFRKAKPKKRKIRDIGSAGKRDVKKQKPRSSVSNTSKENIREPLMTTSTPDVRLTVTTNPSLIQPSGTTTPSRVPPQTPLTPPQPQHSAIPSATQTTLAKVTESLEDSISYPTRKSTTEIIVTPEVTESHRPRPHTIEQRDSPPQSRSSSDLSRFSMPPTIQPHGPQSEVYPEGSASIEGQLEQATRSRDTSPYRQYHEYEQTFDTPIEPRLQTQTRGLDTSLFSETTNIQSETSMPPYPAPQSPYDDPTGTPPRGRPDSVYSFDDNPGPTVPSPRPLQRSSPGSSQRSRRGRDRRGGNR